MDENMELMKETLQSAEEYLVNVNSGIEKIVYNFQSGKEELAIPMCLQLFEGIKWLLDCFELTKPFQSHKNYEIEKANIDDINNEIIEAFENKDYILLGDLLEYEFLPISQKWAEDIEKVLS